MGTGVWGLSLDDSTCDRVAGRFILTKGLHKTRLDKALFYSRGCLSADFESVLTFLRSTSRKDSPVSARRCSSLCVQSHVLQAQGSAPFSSRQRRRSWASCTRVRSKDCFQYGR